MEEREPVKWPRIAVVPVKTANGTSSSSTDRPAGGTRR